MSESSEMPSASNSSVSSTLNSLDFWDYTIELECLQETSGKILSPHIRFNISDLIVGLLPEYLPT